MKIQIGVMGSASGEYDEGVQHKCFELGQAIARRGAVLVTGACPGYPFMATMGCKSEGGLTVGISPGINRQEHETRYESPVTGFDVIIYTGMGFMGRESIIIRSCDFVIIVGGRSGTLGEFAIAYDEGRLIGVVEGTGGIADQLREIEDDVRKPWTAGVLYDEDPVRLLDRLIEAHNLAVASVAKPKG
jgi:hypothetical protein